MAKDFSLADVNFRETGHIAFADKYITSYVSTDIVPKIYMSVHTPLVTQQGLYQASPSVTTAHNTVPGQRKRHLSSNIRK